MGDLGDKRKRQVAQEKALEFDALIHTSKTFEKELVALRIKYTGENALIFQQNNPCQIPEYSDSFLDSYFAKWDTHIEYLGSEVSAFTKVLDNFMQTYRLSREWRPHLSLFVLTGLYTVPSTHYFIEINQATPEQAAITIGPRTSETDIRQAYEGARERMKNVKVTKFKGGAYKFTEDPHWVDLIKETTVHTLNMQQLNYDEEQVYKKTKNLKVASDKIFQRRKERAGGGKPQAGRPRFVEKLSDREHYKLSGSSVLAQNRSIARLKKNKAKYKKL